MTTHLNFLKKSLIVSIVIIFTIVMVFSHTYISEAASISATPAIVDLKGMPRDILKANVVLENNSGRYVELYPFVNNISIEDGKQVFLDPASADNSSSLANWIELSRSSIILQKGEKKTIDFLVNVNLRASPGIYHAIIAFAPGATRAEAEERMGEAFSVPINLEIAENIKERLKLKKFISDKTFFSGFPINFSIQLENNGNRQVSPTGEIRIYNRSGEEVSTVKVGTEEEIFIAPDTATSIQAQWKGPENGSFLSKLGITLTGWGRYKALLDIEYGSTQTGRINDTVFFWVISWPIILIFFFLLVGIILCVVLWIHRVEKLNKKALKHRKII